MHDHGARGAQAEAHVADAVVAAVRGERRIAARLGEAARIDADPGEAGEGLIGDVRMRERRRDLAEHLPGVAAVGGFGAIEEAREDDGAAGGDVAPRPDDAAAHDEGAGLAAGVGGDLVAVDVSRREAPVAHADVRARVADGGAGAPVVVEHGVHAGHEPAEGAVGAGRIAVAVEVRPGAVALRPEADRRDDGEVLVGAAARPHAQPHHRRAVEPRDRRRPTGAERGGMRAAARARVVGLHQAAEQDVAHVVAVVGERARHGGVHLARQCVEPLLRARSALHDQSVV